MKWNNSESNLKSIVYLITFLIIYKKRNSFHTSTGSPHFTRFHFARFSLYTRFIIVPNEFTLCNALHDFLTLHCQKTLSELYLSTKGTVFHFTRISLYTIYFQKQKSCKVRATCTLKDVYWKIAVEIFKTWVIMFFNLLVEES